MSGRWAGGIVPRNFSWVLKDSLALSERPGGTYMTHRSTRRHEELLWIDREGFSRVVSLLSTPHNLHAYEQQGLAFAHLPVDPADARLSQVLEDLYTCLRGWLSAGEKVLVHHEQVGDVVLGVAAGYLLWSGRLESTTQAVTIVERLVRRRIGSSGRSLVAAVAERPRAEPV